MDSHLTFIPCIFFMLRLEGIYL